MNDLVTNPFGQPQQEQRSVAVAQTQARENAEVLAMVAMAKRFPRDIVKATDKIINAFARPSLAEQSQYQFDRGGTQISGPSIRSAEAIAQQWGNMHNGWREVERWIGPDGVGQSLVEAYCVDYESNSREAIQFVVRHWRDTRQGGYKLKDERDIYELCANQAQRRKRACILAQIPGDVVDTAMNQATATLTTTADVSTEGQQRLLAAFAAFNVTQAMIEKKIQRRMDAIQPAQVVMLRRIYKSLDDGASEPSQWFEIDPAAAQQAAAAAAAGTQAAAAATAVQQAAAQRAARKKGGQPPAADAPADGQQQAAAEPPPPPPPAATPAPPAPAATAADAPQTDLLGDATGATNEAQLLATYLQAMEKVGTSDAAVQLLDESRSTLKTPEARAQVAAAFEARFPDGA
jgi:hypothetical protein